MLTRVHPADAALVAFLLVAVAVAAARAPAVGPSLYRPLLVHAGLLAAAVAVAAVGARRIRWRIWQWIHPLLLVAIVFTLYTTIGRLGMAMFPPVDARLSAIDTWTFGTDPALAIHRLVTPAWVEFSGLVYAWFIPYVYLSIILGCLGRPPVERAQFLTGWVFTYAIVYLGYLFLPAQGPIAFHADLPPLPDGFFHRLVEASTAATGGYHGAFPSLHVGASVYLCGFDLGTNRLRGLTYVPVVAFIYVSTLVLRYHYAIDLVAGTAIAAACIPLGRRVVALWIARRVSRGLEPLPGESV